ncbi:MAG TPA: translocation/assembly module TamB domain-containing protein, partial [Vitreimonas sp.]|nr:translocation/assembly module TamB domain-containing protein [Vitreimonas sp.]
MHLANGALRARADGRFEDFDPATLAGNQQLAGNVTGTLNVSARVADISAPITPEAVAAEGQISLAPSEVGGLQIESAHVDGRYENQVADLARLQASGPDLDVNASGQLALDRTSESNLTYRVEAIGLEELARLAGQEGVTGSAILEGRVTGNAASLRTSGTLDGSNLGYQENNALDLSSTYTVTLPELDPSQVHVEADTTATFVQAGGLQLNSVTARTAYSGNEVEFTTELREETRELGASGRLILHPDHQEVHLPTLSVRTQGVEWVTAPGTEAAIQYGQDQVRIENLRLVSGAQSLDVSGVVALRGEDPAGDLAVRAQNVDLQQLETLLLMDRGIGGTLSAEATLTGTLEAPAVDGRVEIVNGSFQNYQYEALTADVDYAGNRINLDAKLQQSRTEFITATGTVPTSLFEASPAGHVEPTEEDRVDLHIRSSDINLGFIQGITDQVTNVTGTLVADVRVTGSGQDPHVEGFVEIKGGGFGVPLGGVSYTGLDTRIELAEDVVRIPEFTILDENGAPMRVAGELAVHARQVGAVDIAIDSKNFEVIDNELGDVGIDSNIRITGELRRPVVQGTVRLATARLEVDRILQLTYDPYAVEELPPVVSAERAVEDAGGAADAARTALRRVETEGVAPEREAADRE